MKTNHAAKKILSLILVFVLVLSLCPAVSAAEQTPYAMSLDGNTKYYSIDDAWAAAKDGTTIVMQRDWYPSDALELEYGVSAVIYMNGFKIDRNLSSTENDGCVFLLEGHCGLMLKGVDANDVSKKQTISYLGWTDTGREQMSITSGGVITGGWTNTNGGGIHVEGAETWIYLDNVAMVGNRAQNISYDSASGGGLYVDEWYCHLYLKNGATIANNRAVYGGGIYVADRRCTINLSNGSSIDNNYASQNGGGIGCSDTELKIEMTGSSSISHNIADLSGGAFFTSYSQFNILSSDCTAQISYNTARNSSGGAISMTRHISGDNVAEMNGIHFIGNWCKTIGGAVYLYQEHIDIRNCVIQNNYAGSEGGGVYNDNDYNAISNTTITNNSAGEDGGGIYCSCQNDLGMGGKVIVKNNTRGDGSADDLYLNDTWLSTAYLTGAPEAGSEVGVRTDVSSGSSRKIGKSVPFDQKMFFSDVKGFSAQYSASSQELWLKSDTSNTFSVTVNGKVQGYYVGESNIVTLDAAEKEGYVFKQWVGSSEDVALLKNYASASTSFEMPKRNVTFTAEYAPKIQEAKLQVSKLKPGTELPTTATLQWTDENGTTQDRTVTIYWIQETADSKVQLSSGTVAYGAKYSVAAVIPQDALQDLAFADDISVGVKYSASGIQPAHTAGVSPDGTLYIFGHQVQTDKAEITRVYDLAVDIMEGSTLDDLIAAMPKTAYVKAEDGEFYEVPLQTADYAAQLADFFDEDGKIKDEDRAIPVALDLTNSTTLANTDNLTATVDICITYKKATSVPTVTFTPDEADSLTVNALLECATEGATIHYTVYDGTTESEEQTCASGTTIALTAEDGTKTTFVIKIWAQGDESTYKVSQQTGYSYTVDNPFTVNVYGEDTGGVTLWDGEAKTYEYYKGEAVSIGAPIVTGELFSSWTNVSSEVTGAADATVLSVASLTSDCDVTAVYNPIVTGLSIALDVPVAEEPLAAQAISVQASTDSAQSYDVSEFLESVQWSPEASTAAYDTTYTAKLVFSCDGNEDFIASALSNLTVNGGDRVVTATATEDGDYVVYVTFPPTEVSPYPDPTYTEPTAKRNLVADGTDQLLINPGKVTNGTMVYSLSKDGTYTEQIPTGNAAGIYSVWFQVLGDEGYNDIEPDYVTVEISAPKALPRPTTTTPTDQTGDSSVTGQFTDLAANAWYADGVTYCLEQGLMQGVSSTKFAPNAEMTRAQLVTILWRLAGEPVVNYAMGFQDVSADTWYTEAVRWAASTGVVSGITESSFAPNQAVTREQLAAILYRYAKNEGMDVSVGEDTNIMDYDDVASISSYAVSAIQWAAGEGIITGTGKYTLSPQGTATRAQTACMLQRFAEAKAK